MTCRQNILIYSTIILLLLLGGCRQLFEGEKDAGVIETYFVDVQKIVVNSPVKGDIFKMGESIPISWFSSSSSISNVDILLYRKSVLIITIASNLVNDGNYSWHIPDIIDNSIQYRIKVVNSDNPEIFNYSGRFGIENNN